MIFDSLGTDGFRVPCAPRKGAGSSQGGPRIRERSFFIFHRVGPTVFGRAAGRSPAEAADETAAAPRNLRPEGVRPTTDAPAGAYPFRGHLPPAGFLPCVFGSTFRRTADFSIIGIFSRRDFLRAATVVRRRALPLGVRGERLPVPCTLTDSASSARLCRGGQRSARGRRGRRLCVEKCDYCLLKRVDNMCCHDVVYAFNQRETTCR